MKIPKCVKTQNQRWDHFWDILTLHPHNSKSSLPTTGTFWYVELHINVVSSDIHCTISSTCTQEHLPQSQTVLGHVIALILSEVPTIHQSWSDLAIDEKLLHLMHDSMKFYWGYEHQEVICTMYILPFNLFTSHYTSLLRGFPVNFIRSICILIVLCCLRFCEKQ